MRQKNCTPFYFLNIFVKSRSILIIFVAQIPEWICNKMVTKLSTCPNECHYTTLWNTTCAKLFITSVMQVLNVMHDKLTVKDKHVTTNVQCLPLTFTRALRRFRHWLMIDQWHCVGFPTMVKSFLQALLLNVCVWCILLTSTKCQFLWRSDR